MTCTVHNNRLVPAAHAATFSVANRAYALHDTNFNVTALITRFTLIGDGGIQNGIVDIVDQAIVANHWQQSSGNVQWLVNERFIYDAYGTFGVLVRDAAGTWHDDWHEYLGWANFHQGLRIDRHTGTFESGRWVEGTGWYENRHRIYSATMARFAQQDPMGYVDGMSLYAAYGKNPINLRDPSGLRVFPREDIGGSYAEFVSGEKRFIYTEKAGWLDRSHFGLKDEYGPMYERIKKMVDANVGGKVTANYGGPIGEISAIFEIRTSGHLAGHPNNPIWKYADLDKFGNGVASSLALGILGTLYVMGENFQTGSLGDLIGGRAATDYSLEDLPTNWVSLIVGRNQYHGSKKSLEDELADIAGKVLSEADAKCL